MNELKNREVNDILNGFQPIFTTHRNILKEEFFKLENEIDFTISKSFETSYNFLNNKVRAVNQLIKNYEIFKISHGELYIGIKNLLKDVK